MNRNGSEDKLDLYKSLREKTEKKHVEVSITVCIKYLLLVSGSGSSLLLLTLDDLLDSLLVELEGSGTGVTSVMVLALCTSVVGETSVIVLALCIGVVLEMGI